MGIAIILADFKILAARPIVRDDYDHAPRPCGSINDHTYLRKYPNDLRIRSSFIPANSGGPERRRIQAFSFKHCKDIVDSQ